MQQTQATQTSERIPFPAGADSRRLSQNYGGADDYSTVPLHRAAVFPRTRWRTHVAPILMMAAAVLALCEVWILWRMQERVAVTDELIAQERQRMQELIYMRPDLPLIVEVQSSPVVVERGSGREGTAQPAPASPVTRPHRGTPRSAESSSASEELRDKCRGSTDPLCGLDLPQKQ